MFNIDKNSEPNRLINETSPYLLQHAHNPVDWYPWDTQALQKAREENKPIFLSIGYSACHWCHVMAHESFEDEEIATYLNEHFVSIKVDREERPDIDKLYQRAAQLMGVQGGWPLSAFLTPEQEPFWIGTYLPPQSQYGRPGFKAVLVKLSELYSQRQEHVKEVAQKVANALRADDKRAVEGVPGPEIQAPARESLQKSAAQLLQFFDHQNGGFGTEPKFPNPQGLEVLLRAGHRSSQTNGMEGESEATSLQSFFQSLDAMAAGGVYDQLGGGFHRYSVDATWSVPHFEKMLYDNAQLVPLYLAGYQLSRKPRYLEVVEETLDYVLREMTSSEGAFFSTQDADSEGEEGKFFVWTKEQLYEALEEETAELLAAHLGVTDEGNFENSRTVLHRAEDIPALADRFQLDSQVVRSRVEQGKQRLFELREQRTKPATDEKVLVSWNGLMIRALAQAGLILREDRYTQAAEKAAAFVLEEMYCPQERRLLRVYKDGEGKIPGYLDDYCYLANGLISLYSATWQRDYLDAAVDLMETVLSLFWDEGDGFFYTPADEEQLIHRPRDVRDAAVPAAGSIAIHNLLLLDPFRLDDEFREYAEQGFALLGPDMKEQPLTMASLQNAFDCYLHGPTEITAVGDSDWVGFSPAQVLPRDWLEVLSGVYTPDLLFTTPQYKGEAPPIWADKTAGESGLAAYVCREFTCSPPATTAEEFGRVLAAQ